MLTKFDIYESPHKITRKVNGKTIDKVAIHQKAHETFTVIFFTDGSRLTFQGVSGWGFDNFD